jgi:glycerophosphoryl diester phosphodiesterase
VLTLILSACSSSTPLETAAPDAGGIPYGPAPHLGPSVSAHRGGAAYAPEDTMTAYFNAARLGVDDLETDTTLTKDGVLVLIHDDTLDRTSNCTGNVSDKTLAELQDCDAGYWFTPGQSTTSHDEAGAHPYRGTGITVPTAQELFEFAASLGTYGPTVTIELKDPVCDAAAPVLVELIHASGIQERITVQSFYPYCLDLVKTQDSSIRTLHLSFATCEATLAYNIARGHNVVAPSSSSPDLDANCVSAAHAAGQQVIPWTVDTQGDLEKFSAMGVDGIITNYPGCMLELLGRFMPTSMTPPGYAFASPAPACPG